MPAETPQPECLIGGTANAETIQETISIANFKMGCLKVDPVSSTGKRVYLFQMILLPFIPIAALIAQNSCTMVTVTLAYRDALAISKQVIFSMH